ncbi:glycosyltransferase [Amycolatopsis sacchari]|uniref:glycosyltransferase n=1 Tax=Amycolatopsis sacchari TaxID=115433 RepID=UPI003D74811B
MTTAPVDEDQFRAFAELIGDVRAAVLRERARAMSEVLEGGTLWHVNSTAAGGGVAEMLHVLVPMYQRCGVRASWAVLDGDDRFFDVTKRLGNLAYGSEAGEDLLGAGDRRHYLRWSRLEAEQLLTALGPRDVVLLHDHQTAGLAPLLAARAAAVYWRCHVGVDTPTAGSRSAWAFLAPLLESVSAVAFSVRRHVPVELRGLRSAVITPVVWPFSAKNRALPEDVVRVARDRCGLTGSSAAPLVVQVSRWDRLKDMHGVLEAFADFVPEAHLALVGPDPSAIPDDVDQRRWHRRCVAAWEALSPAQRRRICLVCLPMTDLDDNALLVNALQRTADVVVQKSLAEGFGLTVTEAMWKARPVIGSAVGGITEQINHGHNGLLLPDPRDHSKLGELVNGLLADEAQRAALGARARQDVHRNFLPDSDFESTAVLLTK